MVELLLSHGADPGRQSLTYPPLFDTLHNRDYGTEMFRVLREKGADMTQKDRKGQCIFMSSIYFSSPEMVRYLVKENPTVRLSRGSFRPTERRHVNFVGNMRESELWFSKYQSKQELYNFESSHLFWCKLRARTVRQKEFDSFLHNLDNPEIWKLIMNDQWIHLPSETILHSLARNRTLSEKDQLSVAEHIARFFVNPFVLNDFGKKAIEYCENRLDFLFFLKKYEEWSPCREKTRWFGPIFEKRIIMFLCILKRIGCYQKDVRNMLVTYIARTEYLFASQ
jgi:hypothetical protein